MKTIEREYTGRSGELWKKGVGCWRNGKVGVGGAVGRTECNRASLMCLAVVV